MPWPVYTTRFLLVSEDTVWHYVTVPAGQRYVVRSLSAMGSSSGTTTFYVSVAGVTVVAFQTQAADRSRTLDCRIPAYAGEQLGLSINVAGSSALLSGFSFSSPALTELGPPPYSTGPPPEDFAEVAG